MIVGMGLPFGQVGQYYCRHWFVDVFIVDG